MKETFLARWWKTLSFAIGVGVAVANLGCVSVVPATVTPAEIPSLRERAIREPGDGSLHLRLGAALLAAGQCEEAMTAAERGRALLPRDPAGPLIMGQCLERDQDSTKLWPFMPASSMPAPSLPGLQRLRAGGWSPFEIKPVPLPETPSRTRRAWILRTLKP